jgi:adenylate cyclase
MENRVILFCDVHCFSKIMRTLGDAMPEFVQAYYDVVGRAVVAQGGRLLKYVGDAVMAVFPQGREADAVRAALAMRQEFPGLVRSLPERLETDLEVAIGSGPVAAGVFGHESLRREDVFGETVNETAVLMHTRGIALTRAARDAVAEWFRTERQPDANVKWRAEPLESWRVVEKA